MRAKAKSRLPRLAGLALALLLLALFWRRVDLRTLVSVLTGLRADFLTLALVLFVPQLVLASLRWWVLAGCEFSEAVRSVLAANALNLVVPGKLGDLYRATVVRKGTGYGFALLIGERMVDVAVIASLGGILAFVPYPVTGFRLLSGGAAVFAAVALAGATLASRAAPRALVSPVAGQVLRQVTAALPLALTVGLWVLHTLQVALFAAASWGTQPLFVYTGVTPWLFLAAVVPLAPWGLGSREAVLATLFTPIDPPEVAAALAVLFLTRYWIPGLAGVFVVGGSGLLGTNLRIRRKPVTVPDC